MANNGRIIAIRLNFQSTGVFRPEMKFPRRRSALSSVKDEGNIPPWEIFLWRNCGFYCAALHPKLIVRGKNGGRGRGGINTRKSLEEIAFCFMNGFISFRKSTYLPRCMRGISGWQAFKVRSMPNLNWQLLVLRLLISGKNFNSIAIFTELVVMVVVVYV